MFKFILAISDAVAQNTATSKPTILAHLPERHAESLMSMPVGGEDLVGLLTRDVTLEPVYREAWAVEIHAVLSFELHEVSLLIRRSLIVGVLVARLCLRLASFWFSACGRGVTHGEQDQQLDSEESPRWHQPSFAVPCYLLA